MADRDDMTGEDGMAGQDGDQPQQDPETFGDQDPNDPDGISADAETEAIPPVGDPEPMPGAIPAAGESAGDEKAGRKRKLLIGAGLALAGLLVGFGVGFGSGFAVGDDDRPGRGHYEMVVDGDDDDVEFRGPGRRGGFGPGGPDGPRCDSRTSAPPADSDAADSDAADRDTRPGPADRDERNADGTSTDGAAEPTA